MRILLVEDDEIFVGILLESLSSQNHIVDVAEDGNLGWEYAQSAEYELFLIDVGLPQLNGISLCAKLRAKNFSTPILLMTAKNANEERIRGLDAGADDYLIKPIDLEELHARIRALSRRGEVIPSAVLEVNGLRLDPSRCEVSYRETPIKLTPKEYNLLELFLRNPMRVFSRSQILDKIWTFEDLPLEESVKAHVKGLRKKLKKVAIDDWIENVYGIGYRLNPEIAVQSQASGVSESIEKEFDRKMAQMWQQYKGLMAERLAVLNEAAIAVTEREDLQQLHQAAEQAAHKLAGVLGMFARDDETQLAREIENLLEGNNILSPLQRRQFMSLVRDLDSLLALEGATSKLPIEAPQLLLIGDRNLGEQLQPFALAAEMQWQQIDNLDVALVWLQDNSPYLVVLDLEAGEEPQSFALISELAKRSPSIPVVTISAHEGLADRIKAAHSGTSVFLVKPIAASQIWDSVSELLKRDRASTTRILVVDDDPVFLRVLRSLIEPWGYRMSALDDPLRFWEVLQATAPDLLILDVAMPEINGIELCQAIRTDPQWHALPILFLTAHRDSHTIERVFAAGADDYATKPIVGAELLARINNRLDRHRLLQNLTDKDPVTGLINQTRSSRELESLLQQAKERQKPLSIALLSMANDELRQINIKYGHEMGNLILQRWSQLLQTTFCQREILSYWGNGEFVVGVAELDKGAMSDRICRDLINLRRQIFTAPNGDRFQISFDVALAEYPQDGDTLRSLYQVCCHSRYRQI
jgi:diguanylate cyclase (GGDEF)-like protein